MIEKIRIKNFKSIIDATIEFNDLIYVLAGQNEAGKSSILEALNAFENDIVDKENLNFEEESNGNTTQSIEVTYKIQDDYFYNQLELECFELIPENKRVLLNSKLFNIEKLKRLTKYTLTKSCNISDDSQNFSLSVNEEAFQIICSSVNGLPNDSDDVVNTLIKILRPIIDLKNYREDVEENIWQSSPSIKLFESSADLLPDSIYVEDIINKNESSGGFKAVKNFEKILGIDFEKISLQSDSIKKGNIEKYNNTITATFQEDWSQSISGDKKVEINFELNNDKSGKERIKFFIKSKDGVFLEPRRRSKGLIWFLSLWLELKASEKLNKIVFLFDEPGLSLHVKANAAMLKVFKKLSKKNHQIIYSTHSPSLIELDKLNNIGLVLNTEKEGTIVEGLTSSKIDSSFKRDALQPISEAMGLEPLKEFSILSRKNIIVEGLSDFWYFNAMAKILNRKNEYKFVPGIGVKSSKLYPLISFCIGYGLEWVLIMENGENPLATKSELLNHVFFNDENEINEKVKIIDFKEIEDMFSLSDLNLLNSKISLNSKKKPSEIIGKKKIIFARDFFSMVDKGLITKEKLQDSTIKNFENIFDFIDEKLYNIKT